MQTTSRWEDTVNRFSPHEASLDMLTCNLPFAAALEASCSTCAPARAGCFPGRERPEGGKGLRQKPVRIAVSVKSMHAATIQVTGLVGVAAFLTGCTHVTAVGEGCCTCGWYDSFPREA